jgi:hypothetical protein
VIDLVSPIEEAELNDAVRAGQDWARVLTAAFLDGTRLVLGWDAARTEPEIAAAIGIGGPGDDQRARLREALQRAARWCAEHGLHLLDFEGEGPGADTIGARRYFMAVG